MVSLYLRIMISFLYFKEIENIAYMEGIRHSDVVRLRGDIELCFLGELSALECFDIVFSEHLEEM